MLQDKFVSNYSAEVTLKDFYHTPYRGEPIFNDGTLLREIINEFDLLVYGHHIIQYSHSSFKKIYDHNIVLVKDIVDICIESKIKGLVYLGSNEALDRNTEGFPVNEEDTWQKKKYRSPYSKSRFIGEMEIWRAQAEGIQTLIVSHSPMFIQPLESLTLRYFVQVALSKNKFLPNSVVAYCDERSATDFIIKAIIDHQCWGNKYLLADGHASIHDIVNTIRVAINKPPIDYKKMNKFNFYINCLTNIFDNKKLYLYKAHYDMLLLNQNFNHAKALKTGYYHPIDLKEAVKHWAISYTV
jgi:nucleoside-diphosphate-sugar epimerase